MAGPGKLQYATAHRDSHEISALLIWTKMITSLLRFTLPMLLSGALLLAPATADTLQAVKRKLSLPPSADLNYAIKAKQSGLSLSGEALLQWRASESRFSVSTETRAMLLGKILESKSDGNVDEYGLAPLSFTEKRFRKNPTTTTFDRQAKTIGFTASGDTYPIKGGEQDRNSAIWQLISIARATPTKFKPATDWTFFVAGQHDAEPWTFKVTGLENIKTAMGDIEAVHVLKASPPDSKGQQLDIWLAPSLEWYPVRLRFTESNGDVIEQSLVNIGKPG